MRVRADAAAAFWAHLDRTGACWEWRGAHLPNGYGHCSGKLFGTTVAHRVAWILKHGPIPAGMDVCHRCDNRKCCRDEHLFPGTRADNMQDAAQKGRTTHGTRHPFAKFTEAQIVEIRRLCAAGKSQRKVGELFGVNQSVISAIVRKATYRSVA